MKPNDFVIATEPVNGIVKNSVGIINSVSETSAQVYFIAKNEMIISPLDSLDVIDVDRTGDDHCNKICNVCHILKPKIEFAKNQTNSSGRPTTRPSCKACRKEIDGKGLKAGEKKKTGCSKTSRQNRFCMSYM